MSKVQEVNGVISQHGHYCLPTVLVRIYDFCLQQSDDIWHTKWTQRHTHCRQTSCLHNVTKHLVYTMSPNISFQGRRKAINFEVGWLKRVYVRPPGSQIYPRKQSADISASSRKRAQRLCAWKVNFTTKQKCW